jgi:hydroxyethylthiazole kinase
MKLNSETLALARMSGELLGAVAEAKPLVQSITNFVSMDIAANALLAIGASPAMVHAPEETPEFARFIDALVINIGTLSKQAADSMDIAAQAAILNKKPWLIDPVGAGGLTFRNDTVLRLLKYKPSIIRGNASEIIGVARILGLTHNMAAPRGVDSTSSANDVEKYAVTLARHCHCTVVATGDIDIVSDGERIMRIANGTPMMTRVTALGCSLSSVTGAFLAVADTAFDAAVATLAIYGIAGEMALEQTAGPASFRVAFLDTLFTIRTADITARLRIV